MYKVQVDDTVRDMTPEEVAALEEAIANRPPREPSPEERLSALEEELAATKILLGVDV